MRVVVSCLLFVTGLMLMFTTGCSSDMPTSQISQMQLTRDQEHVLDLISNSRQEVYLFEFNTLEPFSEIGVRLEVYEYGQLVDTGLGFAMVGMDVATEGNIAVTISQNMPNTFNWTVSLHEGGSSASSSATTYALEGMLGRSHGAMNEAVPIYSGADVVLYVSRFTNTGVLSSRGNFQDYLDPENFAGYPLVYVLVASFS